MLDFIKKLFAKEEEIIEKVRKEDLAKLFLENAKKIEEDLKEKKAALMHEISDKLKATSESLDNLEKADLRNPNISIREKQFMEGNRKAYIQKTAHFLKEIESILDYEVNFFLNHYSEYIGNLGKSTSRAYTILQEFFAHEARDIAIKIKDIDKVVEKIKTDDTMHSYSQVEKIKKDIASIDNKVIKKKELTDEISKLKAKVSELKNKERELLERKEAILSSNEYKETLAKDERRKKLLADIKTMKANFYSDFSLLERPLRKYQRIAFQFDKLIEHYYTDPLRALLTDFNLKIVEILKGLAKNIEDGKIVLKDKRSGKVLSAIDRLDEKYFTNFMRQYNSALKEKEQIDVDIKESQIRKELEESIEKLDKIKGNEKNSKARMKEAQDEYDSINIDNMREKLKSKMEEAFKIKIELK